MKYHALHLTAVGALALNLLVSTGTPALEQNAGFEAIALYPEEIRDAVFEASTHPELVVRVAALQDRSSAAFETLLASSTRPQQEAIWELTRFPGLIDQLVEGDVKSNGEIRQILQDYPQEIHQTALKYGRTEYSLLADIYVLNDGTGEQFAALVAGYPRTAQNSYRTLLEYPEVLDLLADDMDLTAQLADAFSRDPDGVRDHIADLNLRIAGEHASRFRGRESEPAQTVAQIYQQKYAYDDSGFDGPDDRPSEVSTVRYHGSRYPYWFGHPPWRGPYAHASLGWYIAPGLHASVSLFPPPFYGGYLYGGSRTYRGYSGYHRPYRGHHGYRENRSHRTADRHYAAAKNGSGHRQGGGARTGRSRRHARKR